MVLTINVALRCSCETGPISVRAVLVWWDAKATKRSSGIQVVSHTSDTLPSHFTSISTTCFITLWSINSIKSLFGATVSKIVTKGIWLDIMLRTGSLFVVQDQGLSWLQYTWTYPANVYMNLVNISINVVWSDGHRLLNTTTKTSIPIWHCCLGAWLSN